MKKVFACMLAVALVFAFGGCNYNKGDKTQKESKYIKSSVNESEDGTNVGENQHKHDYSSATCTEAAVCSCGDIQRGALGHSYSSATCLAPKKCTRCGITSGNALGHLDNGKGKCSRCGTSLSVDMSTRIGSPNDCQTIKTLGGFSFYKNSADGIKVLWGGKNNTGKTINYYTLTFHFYNSVGDEAYSEITNKATKNVKTVGPVAPGSDLLICSIVDYVPVCSKVQIDEIKLEYSDGTVESGWYGWYTTNQNSNLR